MNQSPSTIFRQCLEFRRHFGVDRADADSAPRRRPLRGSSAAGGLLNGAALVGAGRKTIHQDGVAILDGDFVQFFLPIGQKTPIVNEIELARREACWKRLMGTRKRE